MKNSLFKRAIAAAAAVPLALTQCLTYANAVSTNDVAGTVKVQAEEKSGVTIEDLLYIPADQTVSKWNKNLAYYFASFEGKSGKIDINDYAADIISKAGDYKDVAEYALSLISDVEYNVKSNLDVVITGKIAEPDFNEVIKNEMNNASKAPKKAPGRATSCSTRSGSPANSTDTWYPTKRTLTLVSRGRAGKKARNDRPDPARDRCRRSRPQSTVGANAPGKRANG